MNQRTHVALLVSLAVALNLLSAIVLKEAADVKDASLALISIVLSVVVLINLTRIGCWAAIHRRFQLTDSYPLTGLFFPMILVASAFYGEEIGTAKLTGTLLITVGVVVLLSGKPSDAETPEHGTEPS